MDSEVTRLSNPDLGGSDSPDVGSPSSGSTNARLSNAELVHSWPRPLAFVLSGGSAYGASQVGMVQALIEAKIYPDLVLGTSAGALNGALVANDPLAAPGLLADIWMSIERRHVFVGNRRWTMLFDVFRSWTRLSQPSIISPKGITNIVETNSPRARIEDLPTPFAAIATDFTLGIPKVFTEGPVAQILLASAAIPGVFPAVRIDDVYYVDGGVTANVPLRQAIELGARSAVVLDANPKYLPETLPRTAMGAMMQASAIMLRHQRYNDMSALPEDFPVLHLPQATPSGYNSFDFKRTGELIQPSYYYSRKFLANESASDLT